MPFYTVLPEYDQLDEQEIIGRCQAGDLEAFNTLISRYETRVLNLVYRFLRDHHLAVEESQEIFIKIFRKISLFKGTASFHTWLYRITANHCLNVLRGRRRNNLSADRLLSLDLAQEENYQGMLHDCKISRPDEHYAREEAQRTVSELLDQLPPLLRQALVLFHFEHMNYEEIADTLEVPVTTIRSGIFRARKQLREFIGRKKEKAL